MSADLYATRLTWEGYHGSLKHDGVVVELRACPQLLPGLRIAGIEYAPAIAVATVKPYAEGQRDLTPGEIAHCRAFVARIARAARESLL